MISSHVKISTTSVISSLSFKLYLNSLVYHRNIFGSSSKVFGNLRQSSDIFGNFPKFSKNVRERSSSLRNNFEKSSESGRKSSEDHQKRRHQYIYVIKRTLHVSSKIWILCSRGKNINRELKQAHFWDADGNRKWAIFNFNLPSHNHTHINKNLFSIRNE